MPPKEVPDYLVPTYAMVMSAYPDGIPLADHLPLAALLQQGMSFRVTGRMLEFLNITDYHRGYHMALVVASSDGSPSVTEIERVRKRLLPFGYEKWLLEQEI